MDSAHGGIVFIQGSNTDNNIWGSINGENCGVIWNDTGLYGATVEYVSGDGSIGIHHVRGSNTVGGGYLGGMIKAWHSEAAYLDEVESLGVTTYVVGPSSARDVQGTNRFDLSYKSCPRLTSGARGNFSKKNFTVHTPEDGWIADDAGFNVSTDAVLLPTQTPTIDNRPSNRFYKAVYPNSVQQTLTVTIDYLQNYDALFFGKNWAQLQVRGSETRGGIKVSVTFQLTAALIAAGWTLNGGTGTVVHNQFKGPSNFFIKYDISHKTVFLTREDHEPAELFGTTTNGDVAATLAAGTSTKTQIWNTPLTANRAVTLSATGDVKDGDYFDIIRTAAATGAFSLNVGTGPLIALGPNQWCRVVWSSTAAAWQLADNLGGTITPSAVAATGAITSSGTGGVGYNTGSGGAVTQLTSRTTGVTINKPTGQITLVSAAGSATWATFTVTNSTVAATDTIEVVQKSGANLYSVLVTAVAAGSFNVSVSAVSGTATEAPVLNFTVTKGVNA
jgi:hypothetical protein